MSVTTKSHGTVSGVRVAAILAGVAIMGTTTAANLTGAGWGDTKQLATIIGLAVALCVGAAIVARAGWAWLLLLVPILLAGEAYQVMQTVQRVLVQAEVQQQPHRDQLAKRAKAEALVVEARNAVSGAEASPRLRSAEQALQAANTAVSTSAAEKSCALNCRTLLEAQVTAATAEVSAARQELERRQKAAATTLADAKSALDALPSVEERTVVERRLGVEQWMADIVSALLLSIGANGAAFAFMAWGWHRPTETVAQPMPTAASVPVRAPIADVVDTTATAAEPHLESDTIGRFLAERTTIAEGVSTPVGMLYAVYQSWCADVGAEAVSLTRFGVTLGERGVKKARINGRVALVGIAPGARAA